MSLFPSGETVSDALVAGRRDACIQNNRYFGLNVDKSKLISAESDRPLTEPLVGILPQGFVYPSSLTGKPEVITENLGGKPEELTEALRIKNEFSSPFRTRGDRELS